MTMRSNDKFMKTAGVDFLKADAAIAKFCDTIYADAKEVLSNRESELNSVGISMLRRKLSSHPKDGYVRSGDDGQSAEIGARVPISAGGEFYLYVWWRVEHKKGNPERCTAVAWMSCATVKRATTVSESLRTTRGGFLSDGAAVYCEIDLRPEDFTDLRTHFNALVELWVTRARATGGLKKQLR